MVDLERLEFVGSIANRALAEITGPQFNRALARIGWREAHNGHFFMRLRERGPDWGLVTPGDVSRRWQRGYTTYEGNGRARRYLAKSSAYVVYVVATRALITIRHG